jgi:hypothetical protein
LKRDPSGHLQLSLIPIQVNEAAFSWDNEPVTDLGSFTELLHVTANLSPEAVPVPVSRAAD